MVEQASPPGPADVGYFTEAQAGAWGDTLRAFVRFARIPHGGAVLDVGSGPGLLPRLCVSAGARLAVASDESVGMARRAAELAGAEGSSGRVAVVVAAAARLPFAGSSFDAVLATNLLFLLPEPRHGLAELVRICRPAGVVAFLNPSDAMGVAAAEAFASARGMAGFGRFSFVNYGRLAEAYHRLSPAAWTALAETAGLENVESETRAEGLIALVRATRA